MSKSARTSRDPSRTWSSGGIGGGENFPFLFASHAQELQRIRRARQRPRATNRIAERQRQQWRGHRVRGFAAACVSSRLSRAAQRSGRCGFAPVAWRQRCRAAAPSPSPRCSRPSAQGSPRAQLVSCISAPCALLSTTFSLQSITTANSSSASRTPIGCVN